MNIFVLNTGRCGSTTFIQACRHITNYSSAHESLLTETGKQRLDYPENHIEADNRLSWFLGRLDEAYGDNAFYVHLSRDRDETANSFSKRIDFGILKAYEQGILLHNKHRLPAPDIAHDHIETVESNIRLFLKDKSNKMEVVLETIKTDFIAFWNNIKAQGNLDRVLVMTFSEFGRRVEQNASGGTDHGAAAPLFLIGSSVKAGFAGRHPSLAPEDLFRGDLKFTVDFRSVYATVLERWLQTNSQPILGRAFPVLDVV